MFDKIKDWLMPGQEDVPGVNISKTEKGIKIEFPTMQPPKSLSPITDFSFLKNDLPKTEQRQAMEAFIKRCLSLERTLPKPDITYYTAYEIYPNSFIIDKFLYSRQDMSKLICYYNKITQFTIHSLDLSKVTPQLLEDAQNGKIPPILKEWIEEYTVLAEGVMLTVREIDGTIISQQTLVN